MGESFTRGVASPADHIYKGLCDKRLFLAHALRTFFNITFSSKNSVLGIWRWNVEVLESILHQVQIQVLKIQVARLALLLLFLVG